MFLAAAIKPFLALGMLCIARPLSWLIGRYMKDGKLKRMLFTRW
jgi:hypothetical protein